MTDRDGPIVAAVREARAKIAAECDYDLDKLFEQLKKIEAEHPERVRSPKGKRRGTPEAGARPQ
jgi:hypothetical protein